jgi:hypothetical protein
MTAREPAIPAPWDASRPAPSIAPRPPRRPPVIAYADPVVQAGQVIANNGWS